MVPAKGRVERSNGFRIEDLNSLSKLAKTLYDKADIPIPINDMPTNPSELKASGLKATLPRLKILEIFQNSPVRHLSAEDVYKILLTESMDVGLATVYRVLTQFEQAGLLHRNHFETGKAVFELNEGSHHDHLVCLDCGRVEEFFDEEIEKRQQRVAKERGFNIAEHALALYGHCTKPDCPHRPR
ncbi:ferric iron uptake transcriptional regulator [Noviherbaspirillum agri]